MSGSWQGSDARGRRAGASADRRAMRSIRLEPPRCEAEGLSLRAIARALDLPSSAASAVARAVFPKSQVS